MSEADWDAGFAKSLTVFLNGDAISEPGPRGEPIVDDSFLLMFNAAEHDLEFTVPPPGYGEHWVTELDTSDPRPDTDPPPGQGGRGDLPAAPLASGAAPCLTASATATYRLQLHAGFRLPAGCRPGAISG